MARDGIEHVFIYFRWKIRIALMLSICGTSKELSQNKLEKNSLFDVNLDEEYGKSLMAGKIKWKRAIKRQRKSFSISASWSNNQDELIFNEGDGLIDSDEEDNQLRSNEEEMICG